VRVGDGRWTRRYACIAISFFLLFLFSASLPGAEGGLRVGAAAVNLRATDDMIIGGSILGRTSQGQEGELRAVATVIEGPGGASGSVEKVAIIACDVLMMKRDVLDAAAAEIQRHTGIPASHVMIHCTHTHHAPSTCTVHGYVRQEGFTRHVRDAIVEAARLANERLEGSDPAAMRFRLGHEATVGQNSRLRLDDGFITWRRPANLDAPPTGPFDPELPVVSFALSDGAPIATLFNHSTHTIGALSPRKRSPAFYGLAAQAIEAEFGGVVTFLQGASGSTHNWRLTPAECKRRIESAVHEALDAARPMPVHRVAAARREITVRVRDFDEAREDRAVVDYCTKYMGDRAPSTIRVFRDMRRQLADQRGRARKTWVQAMRIGDVALVAVPAEYFTGLGLEIKRRSPFRYTCVVELANDWIGYVPDDRAYGLGGYQVWTGLHSWVARGTGEAIVDHAVELLEALQ
jgi:hypothetical protein